jgi:Spy/CpxP family protein refolding chaperone
MFRYAYCGSGPHGGFGPRFGFGRHTHGASWSTTTRAANAAFSRHHGPTMGVRRPLRYLAFKLDLDEAQVRELAGILDRLKTARAQADVDWQRSTADIAGALEAADFDTAAAQRAMDLRGRSAEALRAETLEVLRRVYTLLDPEQRRELAFLVRSGGVTF